MDDARAVEQSKTLNHDAGEWSGDELRERAATFLDIPTDQAHRVELGQH